MLIQIIKYDYQKSTNYKKYSRRSDKERNRLLIMRLNQITIVIQVIIVAVNKYLININQIPENI